jgi:hypothetical protein
MVLCTIRPNFMAKNQAGYQMKFKNMLVLFFVVNILFLQCATAQNNLFEGEQLVEVNKVQTLFKFIKGDKDKPLVIFVPGAAHLARISYGFPGGKKDDFLSYWLNKRGYSFLGVSYPIDNPVYTKIYPSFNIRDWGNQVATLTKKIIDENNLSNHVVVLGWSMGGNIEESIGEAFEKTHINVDSFIGLSAVTPISYIGQKIKGLKGNDMLPNQLLDERSFFGVFANLIEEQSKYNGHEIIPKKVYLNEFLGNIPVALSGQGYHLTDNKFEFNIQYSIDDSGVFHFNHTPWIGLINDDSSEIPKITLIDPSAWNYIRSEMLYAQYIARINLNAKPGKYAAMQQILNQTPQYLSETVHGNHFFFVGQKGASETAQKIELIMQRIDAMKQKINH